VSSNYKVISRLTVVDGNLISEHNTTQSSVHHRCCHIND